MTRPLLADRNLRLLFVGQSLSMFGDSIMLLVLGIWVKDLTKSSAAAGLVILVVLLPTLAGPLAGYVVDRVRRRRFLVLVDLGSALVVLPLLAVGGRDELGLLYVVAFAYGVSFVLVTPATSALVHAMVPTAELGVANGVLQTVKEGLRLAGPLVGAGMYATFGGGSVAILDAGSFVAGAICLTLITFGDPTPSPMPSRFRENLAAGMRHIWTTPALRRAVAATAVALLVIGFAETVFFAVVDEGLHRPASFLGVLLSVQGVGAIIGGGSAAPLIRRRNEIVVVAVASDESGSARVPPPPRTRFRRSWHTCGMTRVRVSTTVDEHLLADARRLRSELTDAALVDEALAALLDRHRNTELDAAYAAYDEHPLDEPDEWGDLASFRAAAGSS